MANFPALLALEDGSLFRGSAFGYLSPSPLFSSGEVVFNTALSGYQEIITDPSYAEQLVTLTYPQIGNVGVNPEDLESDQIFAKGLIVRKLPNQYHNWRANSSLTDFLAAHKTAGISNIDTRMLTRLLREKGALNGCLLTAPALSDELIEQALLEARNYPGLVGKNLAEKVSTVEPYTWQEGGSWNQKKQHSKRVLKIVALDFGIKKSILRIFHDLGCHITVLPYQSKLQDILSLKPDGVFLSNGPGDPKACDAAVSLVQSLIEQHIPLFGICLGHQLLAISLGLSTKKMKFGHHGGNHPVQNLLNKQVLITSQNHGFTIDESNIPDDIIITHRSLFDNTIQGIQHKRLPIIGFQGHPEAGPGPNEGKKIFHQFIETMKASKQRSSTQIEKVVAE